MLDEPFPPHLFFNPANRRRDDRGGRRLADPSSEHEVFTRFQETLGMLMGTPGGPPGGMQTRTFISPAGRTTFSFTTGTVGPGHRGFDHAHHDEFDMYGHPHPLRRRSAMPGIPEVTFISVDTNADRRRRMLNDALGGGHARPPNVGQPGLESGLQGLFSLLLGPAIGGPNAAHGDAVYSQEALDRIITQMMENNPSSNAAPPATEAAIQKLDKKKLDQEMMGESGKADCTICMDDLYVGDEVTVLPCKHWFHGECVVLWLKEHNTCPICRSPIEKRDGHGHADGNGGGGASGGPRGPRRRASDGSVGSNGPRFAGGLFGGSSGNSWGNDAGDMSGGDAYHTRADRTREENARRLEAIRNLAGPSRYGEPQSDVTRRDSWSPTSPPPGSSSARDRSPVRPRASRTNSSSWNSQRSARDSSNSGGNSNGGGSSNPISWIRDRFGGGSGQNRRRS